MEILFHFVFAFIFMIIIIPLLSRLAVATQLVDVPNSRKVHATPTPLVGGLGIGLTLLLAFMLQPTIFTSIPAFYTVLSCANVLLVMGVIDDKKEIRPIYKLIIQIMCAYMVVRAGIKVDSLFGFMGIYDLPAWATDFFTVIIITGVVNAYNLIDGVDGLTGMMGILAFGVLLILTIYLEIYPMTCFLAAGAGSIVGFLKFNLGSRHKIFLGDAGSLFLGFLIVCQSIIILQYSDGKGGVHQSLVLMILVAIMFVPVFDSIRVYIERWTKGKSPFTPERNHIHHLLQNMELSPVKISIFLVMLSCLLLLLALLVFRMSGITVLMVLFIIIYKMITSLLKMNKSLNEWKNIIKKLENH